MATLDQIIDEALALSPAEKRKLRQALDRELEQPSPLESRAKESAWIDRHRDEYLGQWVAIEGDTLIAHGARPRSRVERFPYCRARNPRQAEGRVSMN